MGLHLNTIAVQIKLKQHVLVLSFDLFLSAIALFDSSLHFFHLVVVNHIISPTPTAI